jgi:hypothetical protein
MQSVRAQVAIAAGQTNTLRELQIAVLGPSGRRQEDTRDCPPA